MKDKICLVTGATSGLGEVTARTLAQKGATVIVVGRDQEKSRRTAVQMKQQTGNSNVEAMIADLSIQKDVRELAGQFLKEYRRLDVLINNAGAAYYKRQETVDGIEMTFAVNYLGHFLLTHLLLDTLKASAPARVINVSSRLHETVHIDFDDLQSGNNYSGEKAYGQAKLAVLLWTYELARRLEGAGVTVNALNPGLTATNFGFGPGSEFLNFMTRSRHALQSPEQGADTIIYLATSPEVEHVTGKYFREKKLVESSKDSYDHEASRRLWQLSLGMTHLMTNQK